MPKIAEMIRSMSQKIKTDQPLTAEERNLLGVSSVPIYKILAVQAASGFTVNNSEINVLAEITAIDVLNSIVQRLMDQIAAGQSSNLNASDMKNIEQFNAQVAQVRARLVQHEISVNDKVNQTFDIINNAIRIESTLQSRMAPAMAASLNFSRALSAQGLRP
jgi:conjugative transfer pilus assembly protein TraH